MVEKILVVDDEQDIVDLISYNLRKEGYEVQTASNGTEAVEKAASFSPDLMVLDVMMPGMDGFEVCRTLRLAPSTSSIAVMFLTARSA